MILQHRSLRRTSVIGACLSALFVAAGVWVIWRSSPSPHGYTEILVGIPLCAIGGVVGGGTALLNWKQNKWPTRVVGALFFAAGIVVLGAIAAALIYGR